MANKLVETLAETFIHDARDDELRSSAAHFDGSWAVAQRNDVYEAVLSKLDPKQKDLLWKMLTEAVDGTIGRMLQFADHKRVTGEIRITLKDTGTLEQHVFGEDEWIDLPNEYWFGWLERYATVRQRPAEGTHATRRP